MRIVFLTLMVIHGLIHLLGFVKGFGLAPVSQLSAPISRPVGALPIRMPEGNRPFLGGLLINPL